MKKGPSAQAVAELGCWTRDEDDPTPTWRRAGFVIERDGMDRYVVYRALGGSTGLPSGVCYASPGEAALAPAGIVAEAERSAST